jgi:hypothetical protein
LADLLTEFWNCGEWLEVEGELGVVMVLDSVVEEERELGLAMDLDSVEEDEGHLIFSLHDCPTPHIKWLQSSECDTELIWYPLLVVLCLVGNLN